MNGRHALVTGGGSGIGLAIARALADGGAQVTITGRDGARLKASEGDGLFAQVMDVTEAGSVEEGFAKARTDRGPVTIVVANAGLAEGRSLPKSDPEFWRRIMATNLDGAYLTLRAALPDMLAEGWGRGIAVSSIAGLKGLKGAAAYTASKHGMVGLIRGLAADYTGTGLTFNALCPGYVDTEIITRNVASIRARTGKSEAEARDMMEGLNPHGRLIDPGDVASFAAYLCTDGSGSVNGQALQIAGGEY